MTAAPAPRPTQDGPARPHAAGPHGTAASVTAHVTTPVTAADGSSHPDVDQVLVSADEIAARVVSLGAQISRDYAGREVLLVGVLKGAVMIMADLARARRLS